MIKKHLFLLIFLILTIMAFPKFARAEDYKSDYKVEYFINENNNNVIETNAKFNIQVTNLRSDIYVSKFSITFPKSFTIRNLRARDDNGELNPNINVDDRNTRIDVEFSKPNTGKNSVNNFYLFFTQDNLFKAQGTVWEVILPTIENRDGGDYSVIVNLPEQTDKKISISKPKPTYVVGNRITWLNPQTKTIYAVFGSRQLYQLNLTYHLENTKIIPVYTEVAFPPDMLHQKIYLTSVKPPPVSTKIDDDGNILAKYLLAPKQKLNIAYEATAELTVKPREEMRFMEKENIEKQSKYLLTSSKFWQLSDLNSLSSYKTADQIYSYVVRTLKYDYNRATNNADRFGAEKIISQPEKAVCVEFSDLFIALAREKGIYSREIQGYGFSSDPQIRPLSLVSDVLHSWPEYYDRQTGSWISLDPTWENTSGIDYFNSFDLNHIAFAIHGKQPEYPLPAGMYKVEKSRDVTVNYTIKKPTETVSFAVIADNLPSKLTDNKKTRVRLTIANTGNVSVINANFRFDSQSVRITPKTATVRYIAPYQQKDFDLVIEPTSKNKRKEDTLTISANNTVIDSKPIVVIPFVYDLAIKISFATIFIFFIILLSKLVFVKKIHESRL